MQLILVKNQLTTKYNKNNYNFHSLFFDSNNLHFYLSKMLPLF